MFNAPLSLERANYLINALDLSSKDRVVDLGSGKGAFLQLLVLQTDIMGVGVEHNKDLVDYANAEWSKQNSTSDLQFECADAVQYVNEMKPADAIICVGAEFIFGGYPALLKQAKLKLKPNGKLLVGLVYWKKPPPQDYLDYLALDSPYFDLPQTVEIANEHEFTPLEVHRSNNDEWDIFESYTARTRYEKAKRENDPSLHDRAWEWQKGYFKWGIDIMGFCYLILKSRDNTS